MYRYRSTCSVARYDYDRKPHMNRYCREIAELDGHTYIYFSSTAAIAAIAEGFCSKLLLLNFC